MKTVITTLGLFFLLFSCEGNKIDSDQPDKFYHEDFNIAMYKPDGWEISIDSINNVLHVVSPLTEGDDFQEMINVVKGKTQGLTLTDFFQKNLNVVQEMFEELDQTEPSCFDNYQWKGI